MRWHQDKAGGETRANSGPTATELFLKGKQLAQLYDINVLSTQRVNRAACATLCVRQARR
jgi:hypothetical protein